MKVLSSWLVRLRTIGWNIISLAAVLAGTFLLIVGAVQIATNFPGVIATDSPLHDWQDLAAGVAAIIAAFIGGYYLRAEERAKVDRAHRAARALLPIGLSAFCRYAKECADFLVPIYGQRDEETIPQTAKHGAVPQMPEDVVLRMAEFTTTAPDTPGRAVADLLAEYQIQAARIGDLPSDITSPTRLVVVSNIESYLIDAAKVYCRASQLFDYGRRKSAIVKLKVEAAGIKSALNQLGLNDAEFGRVHESAQRIYDSLPSV